MEFVLQIQLLAMHLVGWEENEAYAGKKAEILHACMKEGNK